MPDFMQKLFVALCSAAASGLLTYSVNATRIEGRLDAVEKTVNRIESILLNGAEAKHLKEKTQ